MMTIMMLLYMMIFSYHINLMLIAFRVLYVGTADLGGGGHFIFTLFEIGTSRLWTRSSGRVREGERAH